MGCMLLMLDKIEPILHSSLNKETTNLWIVTTKFEANLKWKSSRLVENPAEPNGDQMEPGEFSNPVQNDLAWSRRI